MLMFPFLAIYIQNSATIRLLIMSVTVIPSPNVSFGHITNYVSCLKINAGYRITLNVLLPTSLLALTVFSFIG